MRYDYAVGKMPGFGWPAAYDRDEKTKRIWQVTMIERDEMGGNVKDIEVRRNNLTYDEATSLWNELVQDLNKTQFLNDK
jgi:hypothetical protein